MKTNIEDAVVVITGASSGIGRAATLAFCARGARVAAGARRFSALEEVAAESRARRGVVLPIEVDTSELASVQALRDQTLDAFGRIDVWVNNASVVAFGPFEALPLDDFRRVLDVNLMGYVHGARVALEHFRARGRGVLLNNASILGKIPAPYTSAYVASKFAVEGLAGALRQELAAWPDIHVCNVLPGPVDTPIWRVAANYSGRKPKPPPPVHSAEEVAAAMIRCSINPRRELVVGTFQKIQAISNGIAPATTEKVVGRALARLQFERAPAEPGPGHLYAPGEDWTTVSGGFGRRRQTARALVVASVLLGGLTFRTRARRARGHADRGSL